VANETAFAQLERRLMDVIPSSVGACDMAETAYCLRVYYDSLDTPEENYATRLRLIATSVREQALRDRGRRAPDGIWMADNTDGDDQSRNIFLRHDPQTHRICGEIFRLLAQDEDGTLRELRRTLQRVCRRLNRLDWTSIRPVTDDFVVFPADGSHTFYDDYGDLAASAPAERLELLRERGYLGPADNLAQL
jgi:hypothetical protein